MFFVKGVGEGGQRGICAPNYQKLGGQVGFSPPPPSLLDRPSVLILLFFSYFVAESANFSWLASLANFPQLIFSILG